MLKETITYVDYDGVERTEDFYFNLSKTEILSLQMSVDGGLDNKLTAIVNAKNTKEIIKYFKEIIDLSYGVKSDDGRRFIKTPEVLDEFKQSPAYDEMFMKLSLDADYATKFINAIVPDISSITNQVSKFANAPTLAMA